MDNYRNQCKECVNKSNNSIILNKTLFDNTDIDKTINKLLVGSVYHSKRNFNKGRTEFKIHNINFDYLKQLYINQQGLCYYSGIKMNILPFSNWKISLERLDPTKGYIIDNVKFIVYELNGFKQWSTNKCKSFLQDLITPEKIEIKYLDKLIYEAKIFIKSRSKNADVIYKTRDGIRKKQCKQCKYFKPKECFRKNENLCKNCKSKNEKTRQNTLREYILNKVAHTKGLTKLFIRHRDENFYANDITFDSILDLLKKQQFKCYYSNHIMTYGTYTDYSISIERKNPMKGYTMDNICLVCREFNVADHTYTNPEKDIMESSAWNKEKFVFFFEHLKKKYL